MAGAGRRHGFGLFAAVVRTIAVGFSIGGAFLIGCWLSFWANPSSWFDEHGLAVLLIAAGMLLAVVGAFLSPNKRRGR